MGTWGTNYFENDAALDYMGDIEETDDPVDMIEDIFDETLQAGYLDADTGTAAIVAAAYVDRQLNGTRYSTSDDDPLEIDSYFERNPGVQLASFRQRAGEALRRVLAPESELLELWSENEADLSAWRQTIEALRTRLETGRGPLRAV